MNRRLPSASPKKPARGAGRGKPAARAVAPKGRANGNLVRIVVADHLALDRRALAALLATSPEFQVVGEAESTDEAVRKCAELKPSVLVVALRLPRGTAGRTPVADVRLKAPSLPVLAIAERGEGECVILNPPAASGSSIPVEPSRTERICSQGTDCLHVAVAEGASGTIRRNVEPEVLFHAVRVVASGDAWYEPRTATAIMRHALDPQTASARALSERELDVARHISLGRSNKEIAQALGISEPTVKKHVGNILEKLELQDRLQIGLFVARNPLVLRSSGSRD